MLANQKSLPFELERLYADSVPLRGISMVTSLNGQLRPAVLGARDIFALADTLTLWPRANHLVLAVYFDFGYDDDFLNGGRDADLAAFFEGVERLGGGERELYLALGLLVDSPPMAYEADAVIEGFRYVVDFARAGYPDVAKFGWYVAGSGPTHHDNDLLASFPGRDYVDWIGMNVMHPTAEDYINNAMFSFSTAGALDSIASEYGLPLIIVDSSPYGLVSNQRSTASRLWKEWYLPYFSLLDSLESITLHSHDFTHSANDTVFTKLANYLRHPILNQ